MHRPGRRQDAVIARQHAGVPDERTPPPVRSVRGDRIGADAFHLGEDPASERLHLRTLQMGPWADHIVGVLGRQGYVEWFHQAAGGQRIGRKHASRKGDPVPLLGGLQHEVGMIIMRASVGIDPGFAYGVQPPAPGFVAVVVQ